MTTHQAAQPIENLVSITIDGLEIQVQPGTTVMEAAKQLRVKIPHFCWHPGLPIAGVCRFCMVQIQGMPRLQIACNTVATPGMVVTTADEASKTAQQNALEFHLINHPLDCPICDQAGECELQNFYMGVGLYKSVMEQAKQLKPKALDVGRELVLDTERCILCSRCVRFEDHVASKATQKPGSLGIFNRGDHAEIGIFQNQKIEHNYSYNLVDICPVGAFTSKDFRFKQRVWFLQEQDSICPGCSTGCSVSVHFQPNTKKFYRLKPKENIQNNGFWMCDTGRHLYTHIDSSKRNTEYWVGNTPVAFAQANNAVMSLVQPYIQTNQTNKIAVVFTPQYSNEEYQHILGLVGKAASIFVWRPAQETVEWFDGLLERGDRHANTQGLLGILNGMPYTTVQGLETTNFEQFEAILVLGPEIQDSYPGLSSDIAVLEKQAGKVVYWGCEKTSTNFYAHYPILTFAEKDGTVVNYQGIAQQWHCGTVLYRQIQPIQNFGV
jgi:NADH-quinone oxidoreductase subunit G